MALIASNIAIPMLLLSMVAIASATYGGGGYGDAPKPDRKKPFVEGKEKLLSSIVGVRGFIYCKSGRKVKPIKGALARIACLAVDGQGYETAPFSILSEPANKDGFYFATLANAELEKGCKLKECKAFLDYFPMDDCQVPTDENNGISGALLSSFQLLPSRKMKLYTVKSFFYTSDEPKPTVSNNGY